MEIKNSKNEEYDAVTVMKDNRGEMEKLRIDFSFWYEYAGSVVCSSKKRSM